MSEVDVLAQMMRTGPDSVLAECPVGGTGTCGASGFDCGSQGKYGCTQRKFVCTTSFGCYPFNCNQAENRFGCPPGEGVDFGCKIDFTCVRDSGYNWHYC